MTTRDLTYRLEALGLKIALGFFGLMPLDRASCLGGWLGRHIGPLIGGVTKRARRNMARAMPELDPAQIDRLITGMWDNLGRTIAEYAHLDEFGSDAGQGRFEIVNLEGIRRARPEGQGAIIVSGHLANWELLPLPLRQAGIFNAVIYRAANNPYVNDWMVALRERAITPIQIPKGASGARQIVRTLKQGGVVAMLVDQKLNDGIEARFFGLKAMTTDAPASIALRMGLPVIPASIERLKGSRFRMTVHTPIVPDPDAPRDAEIARVTQAINDFLESHIRAHPAQWLWMHNRWPD
ncbi:MAG: lysophospholipid acyltransferase family protein [Parvibaculaceae bacterium]|nr:lysophospholipid acyltransferase family protein [Parvibaculaceae bacterium]